MKRFIYIVLMSILLLNLVKAVNVDAASRLKITAKVTYSKITNNRETIKIKITNKSDKKIKFYPYQQADYIEEDNGGTLIFRTSNGKSVSIGAGKSKTITLKARSGYIGYNKKESGYN